MIKQLKPLRLGLIGFAILCMILKPAAGTEVAHSGWEVVPTLLAPVMTPILIMLLLLDSLMATVWKSEYQENPASEDYQRLKLIQRTDIIVVLAMILWWAPYYYALTT